MTDTVEVAEVAEVAETAETTTQFPLPPAPKKITVDSIACEAIKNGASNEQALAAVKAALPNSKASLASMNWYRNKMRAIDPTVLTARALRRKQAEEALVPPVGDDTIHGDDDDSTDGTDGTDGTDEAAPVEVHDDF